MYWVIFCWPTSPSFWRRSSAGTTTVSSWRMIDAVMYGMIPSANSERRCSEPPENRFRNPRTLLPVKLSSIDLTVSMSTPGAGM